MSHDELLERLDKLEVLGENWDGENSASVAGAAVKSARAFVSMLLDSRHQKAHVSPTPDGGISFEFVFGGHEVLFDIDENGFIEGICVNKECTDG